VIIKNKIFNLFANCKVVKGHTRAVICDLQRNNIYPIPLSLLTILKLHGTVTFNDLLETYGKENEIILEEYFDFLLSYELIFFHDNPELFPTMSDFWDEPFEITNCIIDFNEVNVEKIMCIKNVIGNTPIKALQIRVFKEIKASELDLVLANIKPMGLNSIELILKYSNNISLDEFANICNKYSYIFTITVFNSPNESVFHYKNDAFGQIFYKKDFVLSEKSCGNITPDFFTINTKTYTESLHHNSCLNRKISIDTQGNIKNCPSMLESFGNIYDNTFEEALAKHEFKKYWFINKDQIHACKNCEFRYICTDCRAYLEDPKDILSKPLKCGYNPYSGESTDWFLDSQKRKIIDFYELGELKFQEINLI
jgi:SPASM domain peptide maturase of grasp-with-spasm system